ncbi:MAG: hypothetical protein E7651_07990 [Ruminococcaceae bacterium]|nr:hypothetical protein [Oscillospiraceae bacterium]MBQ8324028.1 hypothetical protein [Clostridia bacterium]
MGKCLRRLLLAFLLVAPYRLDRKVKGGFVLRAVLYEVDCTKDGETTNYEISVLKILSRQIKLLKKLFS